MPFVTAEHEDHDMGNGVFRVSASASASFDRPAPRPPRSPGAVREIRKRNRRLAYLEQHPEYFDNSEHELAGRKHYAESIKAI